MTQEKRKPLEISFIWILLLPLLGLCQKYFSLIGWLEMGSWLNFIALLLGPIIWTSIVLKQTARPFKPLLLIGGIYGLYTGAMELVHWMFTRESLNLGESNWSFEDLLASINQFLIPAFRFLGNFMLGLLIGAITGSIAYVIVKICKRQKERLNA